MQSNKQKTKEFKGLMKIAFLVLQTDKQARIYKEKLVFQMWRLDQATSFGGQLHDFAMDIINSKFKLESYTRAARKVVEIHPELGNPNRKKLAKQMKIVVKQSDLDPNQIEFLEILEEESRC